MSCLEEPEALLTLLADMDFPQRLASLRKERGLTQQLLAEKIGVHVSQLRRYEGGSSQPTLEVLRRMAKALAVSGDQLLFDDAERDLAEALRLQFEAAGRLSPQEQQIIREVIEGLVMKHEVKRLAASA
jgi:transcriptional regulator with XRE-family HTH domain